MKLKRRHELDWLRVILFSLLILYHIGMYFVSWPWHIKSHGANAAMEPFMLLLNPWRLSFLFFISGVATKFAIKKYSMVRFAKLRSKRLLLPIVFGIVFIVPPQTYFELLMTRELIQSGYLDFYAKYLSWNYQWEGVFTPTYNHLWYVIYLFLYTLVSTPILYVDKLNDYFEKSISWLDSRILLIIPILPFILMRFTTDIISPETLDIRVDWGAHIRYGAFFLLGTFVAQNESFWSSIKRHRLASTILSLFAAIILTIAWQNWDHLTQDGILMNLARSLKVCYVWWVMCSLLAWAQYFLSFTNGALQYLNIAIFPYYILHQTILISVAGMIRDWHLPVLYEFVIIFTSTVLGIVLIYEYIIRRVSFLKPLFGVSS